VECYLCGRETTTCTPWADFICNECQENIINEDKCISNLDNGARCIKLKESISDLIMIIEREAGQLPRFYSCLNIMRRNLNICIESNFEDLDELIQLLKEDWASCWQVHTGLDGWYIYRKNYEERLKANEAVSKVKNNIEKLIKFKEKW
jgi:hypothetical protein